MENKVILYHTSYCVVNERILNCAVTIEISVKAFTSHLLTFKHDDLLKHL